MNSPEDSCKTSPFGVGALKGITSCVHCGLCLEACPTYRELQAEEDSPRGRLFLMKGMLEGRLPVTAEVTAPLWRCLDCRACETACPSGVHYGELLEETRWRISEQVRPSFLKRALLRIFLEQALPHGGRLVLLSFLLRWADKFGLPRLASSKLLRGVLPPLLSGSRELMPCFTGRSFKRAAGRRIPPDGGGKARHTVAFFSGCILDVADGDIHAACLKLLTAAGCEVLIPEEQICCGALHAHNGDRASALRLAEQNARAFADPAIEAVLNDAAGCGAQLKECAHLFPAGDPRQPAVAALSSRTRDALDFLASVPGFPGELRWKAEALTVLYDAPCHLMHAQRADAPVRKLLASIPGLKFVPLDEADFCCGSAGIYNLLQPVLANQILDRKLDSIARALKIHPEARVLLTGNPGCLYQIRAGVSRRGLPLRVAHPAVLLAERLARNDAD